MKKHSIKITMGLWDAYKQYKKKKGVPGITRKEYVDICHSLNKKISEKIIKESLEFKMPYGLGYLGIRKNELKIRIKDGKLQKSKMVPDWGTSWKIWNEEYKGLTNKEIKKLPGKTLIYQTNDHSNGYIMKWHWERHKIKFKNVRAYRFKPTKQNRLDLAAHIKSEDRQNDYYLAKQKRNTYHNYKT